MSESYTLPPLSPMPPLRFLVPDSLQTSNEDISPQSLPDVTSEHERIQEREENPSRTAPLPSERSEGSPAPAPFIPSPPTPFIPLPPAPYIPSPPVDVSPSPSRSRRPSRRTAEGDSPPSGRVPGPMREISEYGRSYSRKAPDNNTINHEAEPDSLVDVNEQADRLDAGPVETCHCSDEGRNLVVCIDGTSNEFGEKNTNVIELYSLVQKRKDDRQRTYYNSGIGTYARSSAKSLAKAFGRKLDLAIARHFESIILDAYRWLSETYEDGDRIYLFGFSRGAYQVRVLSAMINTVGLINRGNEKQIPFAYKWYTNPGSEPKTTEETTRTGSQPEQPTSQIHTATRFKAAFSRDVTIHFVGAWDTVSSVGLVRGRKLLPGTTDGMKHVCYFRHALALDERRVKFLPEYACGDAGPSKPVPEAVEKFSNTKEVWFAGTHSDVGGGNLENENLDSARPALRWMYSEASIAGLRFDLFKRKSTVVANESDIKVNESLAGFWWLLEYLPIRHLSYAPRKTGKAKDTRRPHRGEARIIQDGQTIHPSVWLSEELLEPYIPRAYRHSPAGTSSKVLFWSKMEFWRKLQGRKDLEADGTASNPWKEVDIYEVMGNIVAQCVTSAKTDVKRQRTLLATMHTHARSGEGWRALSREVLQLLNGDKLIHAASLCSILDVLVKSSGSASQRLEPGSYSATRSRILPHLPAATTTPDQNRIAQEFLAAFTDPKVRDIKATAVSCVAFSYDGTLVVAGSADHKVRVWDANTGQSVGEPFEGHSFAVLCVAFSPKRKDGKRRIASGSRDRTIQVWDMDSEAGRFPGRPFFTGHTDSVNGVAFSPDGSFMASCSDDCTIRVWRVESGQEVVRLQNGYTGSAALSVAFSPNGRFIVSGGTDYMLRLWDLLPEGGDADPGDQQVVTLWQGVGHKLAVWSVAFSPDGEHIASGSADGTVRIWDVYMGITTQKVLTLEGHGRSVYCVAFAPNGARVVSASNDKTLRFWNPETGLMVGRPFEGHTEGVNSVAYSHDGMRVVSSSAIDRTIRIWDVLQDPV